jgi:hypothetical protein
MNKLYVKKNDVKVCYDKLCVDAKGKNADLIAGAVVVTLSCFAVAAIINALK